EEAKQTRKRSRRGSEADEEASMLYQKQRLENKVATPRELRKKARALQAEQLRKIKEQEEALVTVLAGVEKLHAIESQLGKAVEALTESGMTESDIAAAIGYPVRSVRGWKKQANEPLDTIPDTTEDTTEDTTS
ncbi:hypothetical protein, partial [Corynebacterium sp. CCM 9203]|uniref:hypothetical protein n=1 Tax=Corynebacterium sp. CCM 9203 TaxID=3057615 RepID=UPI0035253686